MTSWVFPGAFFVTMRQHAILKPLLDTRHTGEVLLRWQRIGGSVGAPCVKSYEEYVKFRVEGLAQSRKGAVADKPDVPIIKLSAGESVQPNFTMAQLWKKAQSRLLLVLTRLRQLPVSRPFQANWSLPASHRDQGRRRCR